MGYRSRDRHHKRKSRSRDNRSSREVLLSRRRTPDRQKFRFDSPPKESTSAAHLHGLVDLGFAEMREKLTLANANLQAIEIEKAKMAKELFIGNIPPEVPILRMIESLNEILVTLGANILPGNPIVTGWLSTDSQYCFIEFRTVQECHNGLRLNGYNFMGCPLKVGRPRGYNAPLQLEEFHGTAEMALSVPVALADATSEERLCLCGIPKSTSEVDIKRTLEFFGPLSFFQVLPGNSCQCCLFEFSRLKSQKTFLSAVPSLSLGSVAALRPEEAIAQGFLSMAAEPMRESFGRRSLPSRVIVVRPLPQGTSWLTELSGELEVFGKINSSNAQPGEGFFQFENLKSAIRAKRGIEGLRFSGIPLWPDFYPEKKYLSRDFSHKSANLDHPLESPDFFEEPDDLEIASPDPPQIINGRTMSLAIPAKDVKPVKPKKLQIAPEDMEIVD